MRMEDVAGQIERVLEGTGPIPRETVVLWIESARDLPTLAKLYRLTDEAYYRIYPDLGATATCSLIQRYLLQCIRENVTGDENVEERWEAARTLHGWFCHLSEMEGTTEVLRTAATAVTEHYLAGTEAEQIAIEQGFLEHTLEMAALRPYFQHWRDDERLKPAWERALAWGEAHPGYVWGLLKELQKLQSGGE